MGLMNNKKGQIAQAAITIFVLILLIPIFTQLLNGISCQKEKSKIDGLQSQLDECVRNSASLQDVNARLEDCQKQLKECNEELSGCYDYAADFKKECDAKEQPVIDYYFIKVFSDKIILFEWLILYHVHLFGFFFSIGITTTLKLLEIDVTIKVLDKKNQRKLVKAIRRYLVEHPYMPVLIMVAIIAITNLVQFLM